MKNKVIEKTEGKKKKKKSPIRLEFVIPISIIIAVSVLYGRLFLDGNLRSLLEFVGTQANEAVTWDGTSAFVNTSGYAMLTDIASKADQPSTYTGSNEVLKWTASGWQNSTDLDILNSYFCLLIPPIIVDLRVST